jgi:hypothetical protein
MTQTREAAAQAAELHAVFMRHLPFFERVMLHYADSGSKGTALSLAALWRLAARCRLATPRRPLAALDRLAIAARVQQLYPHPRARAATSPHDPAAPLSLQVPPCRAPPRPPAARPLWRTPNSAIKNNLCASIPPIKNNLCASIPPIKNNLCASIPRFLVLVVDAAPHCLSSKWLIVQLSCLSSAVAREGVR